MEGSELQKNLKVAIKAARRAQAVFQKHGESSRKIVSTSGREVKVKLDFSLENEILRELRSQSQLPILSEESSHIREDQLWWIVDPLDGSLNWLRQIPFFSISISLFRGADPVLGVVLDLSRDKLFYGAVGLGAWCCDSPITVSAVVQKNEAILCTGFPSSFKFQVNRKDSIESIYSEYLKVRMFGSAAMSLAYVASGVADVYWEDKVKMWDVAAGVALVRAAGGIVSSSTVDEDFTLSVDAAASEALLVKKITGHTS